MSTALQALQQQLLHAVMNGTAETPPPAELLGDGLADARFRLDVYRHGYRMRLSEALGTEFPGLRLLAGRHLAELLDHYIARHPSLHYNIRWHGAELPAFLAATPPWREKPQLAEMAWLDWAISTAFDAADQPTCQAADLAGLAASAWASLRLEPQQHLQIVPSSYNLDAFRRAADRGDARPRLRRQRRSHHLLVWRQALEVRYRRAEADELSTLTAAIQGATFGQLCERLAEHHPAQVAMPRMAALLARWLEEGLLAKVDPS